MTPLKNSSTVSDRPQQRQAGADDIPGAQTERRLFFVFFVLGLLMLILTCTTSAFCFSLQPLSAEAAHNQKGLIVLDARPQKGWQQGHLPGAFSFSWEDYTRTDDQGVKYRTLPAQELALALGRLGITEQSSLLIYGDADSSWGGEGWLAWALAWIGHQGPVYVLDGGIQAWQQKGFSLTTETPAATAAVYQTQPQPTVAIAAADIERLGTDINLVDTRSYFTEWLPSHLPGAIHINWEKFFSAPQRRPLSPQACRALLEENGIDLNKPVVYYCTGGIRSGYAWMVHQLAGLPGAINFEGGTEEWAAHRR